VTVTAALVPHGFKDASVAPAQVASWWACCPAANIGVVPGRAGLLVLDVDGDAGAATARALGVPTDTATVETGRGWHLWFRIPPDAVIGNAPLGPCLDVRCHRGYVVAPPSLHPSGRLYAWRGGRPTRFAPLPDALLARLRAADRPSHQADGADRPAPATTGPVRADVWRRLEGYLAKVETGLVADSGRKRAAYRLTCVMLHELHLDEARAWPVLAAWNGDNADPLPPRELRRVFRDAQRRGRPRWEERVA
jgi:hypothetical protein